MKIKNKLLIAALGTCMSVSNAQAALETWEFTGTIYQENSGFTPPAFAAMGQTLKVDYVFDTAASIQSADISVTFDGETSNVVSSNLALGAGSLDAINLSPAGSRTDKVNFMSWNLFNAPDATTVSQFLNDYSIAASEASQNSGLTTNLRLDFGPSESVWALPTSFVMTSPTAVPLPASFALLSSGLGFVGFCARSKNRRQSLT